VSRRSIALVSTTAALLAVAVAGPTLAARGSSQATTVKTTMKEFKFVLSTKTVKKGVVTFALKNAGKLPHDLRIAGKKSKLVAPAKTGVLRVTFKRAGKYPYLCTVPGHAAGGMKGTLTVR
jgi:uncharacterized cupredoxin-like copper-binding protein